MGIAMRLRHDLTPSRYTESGTANARGNQPKSYVDDASSFRGNVQERTARKVPNGELEGVAVSDAIAFLPITTAASSLRAPDRIKANGFVYQLVGLPRDAGGRGRHLEADLRRVTP